jgi:hypothetical protein
VIRDELKWRKEEENCEVKKRRKKGPTNFNFI